MNIQSFYSLASTQNIPVVFSSISGREVLDIAIVALAFYIILLFVKQTRSYFVLSVSLILIGLNIFSQDLNLTLTRSIFQPLSALTFVIIAIIFQREIRRFFRWIITGRQHFFGMDQVINKESSNELAEALLYMAQNKIGAIVVFPKRDELDDLLEGGQKLNGIITKEAILSLFDPGSPGHDGAIIIEHNQIKLFGAHLPLARNYNFRKAGTRHRAATGITEDTDAITLVVSEERGVISVAREGNLERIKDENELRKILQELTGENNRVENKNFWHYFFIRNASTKIISVTLAVALWTMMILQTGISKREFVVPLSFQLLPAQYELESRAVRNQVNVVLQGRTRDISTFDGTKLEVRIDARNFSPGTKNLVITKEMINTPSFLSIADIDPEEIEIIVKEIKTQEETED